MIWILIVLAIILAFIVYPILGVIAGGLGAIFAHTTGKPRIRNALIVITVVAALLAILFLILGGGQYEQSQTLGGRDVCSADPKDKVLSCP
ncbi:MAG: hypothetical protein ACFB50_12515 [Rubrobacteraceae bacterium]